MTPDIETRLRAAMANEALNAPELPDKWDTEYERNGGLRTSARPSNRAWLLAAAASLAVVAGLAAFVGRPSETVVDVNESAAGSLDDPAEVADPQFVPDGEEVVLIEIADAGPWREIVRPGSLRRFDIEGHSDNFVFETLEFDLITGRVGVQICHDENGSSGCGRTDSDFQTSPDWSLTSSISNGYATTNLVTWVALPDEVAFVTYPARSGDQWQRPIGGTVVFVRDGPSNLFAFNTDGELLATAPEAIDPQPLPLVHNQSRLHDTRVVVRGLGGVVTSGVQQGLTTSP